MPYGSTYGKKVYPYQSEELTPEEQSKVPMLTNIPKAAEEAAGRGQDVYFLSDRPETEEFLAAKTPERPYKQVLRDVRAAKPPEDALLLSEARRDFGANEGQKMLGFNPNQPPNPGEIAQTARDKYFKLATPEQIQGWDEKTQRLHYSEAEKRGKAAYQEAIGKVNAAKNVLSMFDKSWTERQKQLKGPEPAKKALSPIDLQTSYPELTPEEAGTAAQAWNTGNMAEYNTIVRGKKITPKTKETREIKRGEEIITEERDPTGTWKEIAKAPREVKTPSFKEKMTEEMWKDLSKEEKKEIIGAMKSGEILNEATLFRLYGQIDPLMQKPILSEELRQSIKPIIDKIVSKAKEKYGAVEKTLDAETARAILKEAGGNKEKARKIAKDRGYKF